MTKRAFIIHGWDGNPYDAWKTWMKEKLKKKGFKVYSPIMPNASHPKKDEWVAEISRLVGKPDENCYFIGHSLGCLAILKYIESLHERDLVGGCVFVSGFIDDVGIGELKDFLEEELDLDKIKGICDTFVVINSDNDPIITNEQTKNIVEKLNAKFILEGEQGHLDEEDNVKELPSALKAVMEMSK